MVSCSVTILIILHVTFGFLTLALSAIGLMSLLCKSNFVKSIFQLTTINFIVSFTSGFVLVITSFGQGNFISHCVGLGVYTAWIGAVQFLLWKSQKSVLTVRVKA